jgi:perosamine synthetase
VSRELGWNSRIHGLSAALIYSQLQRLDALIKRKHEIASTYLAGLSGHPWFDFQSQATSFSQNTYWVFGVVLNESSPYSASKFQTLLRENGIDSRRFFCPMHLQPVLSGYNFEMASDMKVSEMLWDRGIYLPSGLGITNQEQNQIIEKLWELLSE